MAVRIRYRPDKKLWVVTVHKGGKRHEYSRKTESAAKQLKKDMDARLALGVQTKEEQQQQITFGDYFETWIKEHAEVNCRSSTVANYLTIYRHHLQPHFGEQKISGITREKVRSFVAALSHKDLTRGYIKTIFIPLTACLNRAVEDRILTYNPALRAVPKSRQDRHRKINPFTPEQLSHLLSVTEREKPDLYDLLLLLSRTGLRIGEAVALQWGDLSLDRNYLIVRRTFYKGRIGPPKGGAVRRVDMSQVLSNRLLERFQPGYAPIHLVFPGQRGKVYNPNSVRRSWCQLVSLAQLDHHMLKDLRHTYASLLIAAGVPLPYIQSQLGHSSIKITVDTYGHLVPGGHQHQLDQIERTLAAQSQPISQIDG